MAKERTVINQTNNIVYVEPNYNNSTDQYGSNGLNTYEFIPDLEDYSIFVNLEVETIGRTIEKGNKVYKFSYVSKGDGESVNLMSGSKICTTDGRVINSLTTNYTDTHISDLKKLGASPELFGINYIDIAYNNFMVPEVTIEFIDIRGASVFAQKELFESNNVERAIGGYYDESIVNTFFQCFFTFPYPKFSLLVKGFYGQPVAYELTCADFRARFNSEDGNFSCTAKFVGYHFSFLNDVMLNALVAAPYSDYLGADYWAQQKFTFRGINGGEKEIPKIGELLKIMKQTEAAAEHISQSSPEVQEKNNIEQITNRYSELKNRYNTYVTKIKNLVVSLNTTELKLYIPDGADENIIESAIILVGNDASDKFKDYFDDEDGSVNGAYEGLKKTLDKFNEDYPSEKISLSNNFAEATPSTRIFPQSDKNKCYYIIDANNANDDIKEQNKSLYNVFKAKVMNENKENVVNKYSSYTKAYYFNDGGFTKKLNSAMKAASDKEKEIAEKIERTKANAIAKRLGFKPDVENITKIMMAHFETFAYMIHQTALNIENENPKRDAKKIGITNDDDIADVPSRYRSSSTGSLIVPPFPKVTKIVEKGGTKNREESWVGEYGNMFKETDLVNGILNGIEEFVKLVEVSETAGGAGSTSTVTTVMKQPLSPLDLFLTSNVYSEFNQNEVSSLLSLVGLRALQILGLTNFKDWNHDCSALGAAEAENLLKSEKLSEELKRKIIAVTEDEIISMLKGNTSTGIPKPSDNIWPWQEDTRSVGIITDDGEFNICKVHGNNGSTTYTLPIQNLNWNKIKQEVIHAKNSYKSDDYFNIESDAVITNSYKDNIYNVETNINRIKTICESQITDSKLEFYKTKFLDEAIYNEEKYEELFYDASVFVTANYKDLLAYPIKDAANIQPTNGSCMLPCTTSYISQMTWGGGYDLDDFIDEDLGGDWKDKNGAEVVRIKDDGYEDFFKDLNTNNYTLTEVPGLNESLEPSLDTSLFTQKLYYAQTNNKVKGFMLLCSLGYLYDYEKIFKEHICNKDVTISIIPLPAVIFAGGVLWAKRNSMWFSNCVPDNDTIDECYDMLQDLNGQIHVKLIKTFEQWIEKGVQNNNIIVSFKELKNNMELSFRKRKFYEFFDNLGEFEDKGILGGTITWFKEGIFAGNNYENLLQFFVSELGDSFFRNYICVDEDLGGKSILGNSITIGMRVGNRDGSIGVKQYVDFGLAPCIFTKNSKFFFNDTAKTLKVNIGDIKSFFTGFLERLKEDTSNETVVDNSVSQAKDTETTIDIKVGVYRYCKLLYDKWIGGMSAADFEQFKMKSFFEGDDRYFYFIDAYYNYANEIPINIGRFCDMIKESYASADFSLLSFLSSVYSENKFNFMCVQNFLDISSRNNMIKMFDCVPYTEYWDIKRHPNFIVNFAYEASSHLELDSAEYENDGFMVNMPDHNGNKWPEALKSRSTGVSSGLNVPAFGVSYGKMYQSYFKDISVSMDNPTVTEQSIKAQFAIASMNNEGESQDDASKEYTYGQDLYSIYSNNSYTCEVTMMGCAWVQPLMLFVLTNVPMFRGTYQIINVTHHIQQGDMVTKFKGVRMANVTTRIVEECSVNHKNDQTDAGLNSMINRESLYANTDNDCPYKEFPISVNGEINIMLSNDDSYNANQIMMAIMSRGYTREQAAGIVGNMKVESSFDYKVVTCDSNKKWAGGLCQWNGYGLSALIAKDPKNASQPTHGDMPCSSGNKNDIMNQLPSAGEQVTYLLDSLEQDSFLVKTMKVKEHLLTATNPEDAAFYFARDFERCGECNNRGSQTVQKRMSYARTFYNDYHEGKLTPPVVDNGDGKVSDFAIGFLHALNQTSKSSSVNVEVGIDTDKSSGDTIYLTNAKKSPDFGKIFDIMLSTYSKKIQEIIWIIPGNGENQNLPPEGYIVSLKDDTSFTRIKLIRGIDGKQVSAISLEEGGINTDFKRAITKKYKNTPSGVREKLMVREITPKLTEEQASQLFNNSTIKPCNEVMGEGTPYSSPGIIEGPLTTSDWDVNAFVRNLHYWQQNICESRGKKRSTSPTYNGCGLCTGAINRALKSTGCGDKYWATYPWEVCAKMQKSDSDFQEIASRSETNKQEFTFGVNLLPGDICTMWSTPDRKIHYHTCAFDGSRWISDFVQNTCNVYRSHKPCTMEYHIFRHK